MFCLLLIKSVVLVKLWLFYSKMLFFIKVHNILANLYLGAVVKFMNGPTGVPVLWIFGKL